MKKDFFSEISHQHLFTLFDSSKKQKSNSFRLHNHTQIELGYITEGEGTYLLDGKNYQAEKGTLFVVRSNKQHCIPTITSPYLKSFNIYLSPYYLWNVCSDYIESNIIHALVNSEADICEQIKNREVCAYFEILENLFLTDGNPHEIRHTVLELTRVIGGLICPKGEYTSLAITRLDDIQKAINFIKENYKKNIGLDEIAHSAAMSRSYLINSFKAVTGMSPYNYLMATRIEQSVDMLRHSNNTVMNIALECGFTSLASFNKAFKATIGTTPSSIKKRYK